VIRWIFTTLAVVLLAGGAVVAVARFFGGPGSRAAVLVSVVAHWLAAYSLWTFAGGLLLHYGILGTYDGWVFPFVALPAAALHYHRQVRHGREQGLTVFVGAQLLWIVIVLIRNGLLSR
jgi:hypothetical protein